MRWKAGDIALCIVSGDLTRSGTTYVVRDVYRHGDNAEALWFLELGDHPVPSRTSRFIRIDPEILTEVHDLNIERITT